MATETATMSPTWIDKNTVELWLKGHHGNVNVTDINVKAAVGKGENYLSNMLRVTVTTVDGDSHALVVKCKLEEGAAADVSKESNIFNNEREMYSSILPKMHALLEKQLPGRFEPFSATSYFSCENYLVMEDLTATNFKMLDRMVGLSLDNCLLVMQTLARFHATSIVLHEMDPDAYKALDVHFFNEPILQKTLINFFSGMLKTLIEELETWPDKWRKYVELLRSLEGMFLNRIQTIVRPENSILNVLCHGDLWVNNIMFREQSHSVRFYDYQLLHYMSPAMDLNYFLTTSPSLDVVMNHTDTLLKEYHKVLCDTLTNLGYTQKLITLEELYKEFDRKSEYGLYALIYELSIMSAPPDSGFNLSETYAGGGTPGPKMYSDNYRKTLEWMLPDFEKRGAFHSPSNSK